MNSIQSYFSFQHLTATVFWYIALFGVTYFFVHNYAIKKIEKIKGARDRFLSNNLINTNKNLDQVKKLDRLIQSHWQQSMLANRQRVVNMKKDLLKLRLKTQKQFLQQSRIFNLKQTKALYLRKAYVAKMQPTFARELKKLLLNKLKYKKPLHKQPQALNAPATANPTGTK